LVVLLLLVLQEILRNAAEDGTSDRAQETMAGLFSQVVATKATTKSTEETAITLSHGRSVGVVVGCIWVRRLTGEFVVLSISRESLALALCTHVLLLLVGLILGVGVIAAVLLRALLAIVACVALWVASVVGTELVLLLAVLEATLLRRTERILSARRRETLILRRVLLVALLRRVLLTLVIALLRLVTLLMAISLLWVLGAVALALAAVGIVWSRHRK